MPKKKSPPEAQEEQSERFRKAVTDAMNAGELNPTEAEAAVDGLVRRASAPSTLRMATKVEGTNT